MTTLRSVFIGPSGIRAGWRLCIYLAIVIALTVGFSTILYFGTHWQPSDTRVITPLLVFGTNLVILISMAIASFVMSRLERRPVDDYGLPLNDAFRRRFWLGTLVGFLSLTVVLAIIFVGHGVQLTPSSGAAGSIVFGGIAFAIAMLAAGMTEEYLYRGYALTTLAQGIGFWPAATILSVIFAALHSLNLGESSLGIVQVYVFAIAMCYTLRRTGSLWFAVGYHSAWNWAETFFYGVPDSGHISESSLLNGTQSGPAWFSGGSDGPEGSFLALVVLAALIPVVRFLGPARRA